MKFGLIHQTALPDGKSETAAINGALEQMLLADALGYDGAWLTEHPGAIRPARHAEVHSHVVLSEAKNPPATSAPPLK